MTATRKSPLKQVIISQRQARSIWMTAQCLVKPASFGNGPEAVTKAIAQLGYVQIDAINVIERCHHHILFNRIPEYRRADLVHAQSKSKTIFEYWTHALSYVPIADFAHFVGAMKAHGKDPVGWGGITGSGEFRRVIKRIRDEGALAITDFNDGKLVEKTHAWASKKPSKRALQAGFYNGQLVISHRDGMLKSYELTERHFKWDKLPKPATATQTNTYILDRALRAQGLVSLDSICHLIPRQKPIIAKLIDKEVRAKRLVPIGIEGAEKIMHWARPEALEPIPAESLLTHILSPFDPLIIQRKRTAMIFDYEHLFEAYVPKAKRKLGYFTLPVLHGGEIVALLDLKTDRQAGKLLIQAWHWTDKSDKKIHKPVIDAALDRFERFQFGD